MTERHSRTALVLGGGVAGMTAALSLARRGHRVHLVEKEGSLGGLVAMHSVAAPGHEPPKEMLKDLMGQVEAEDRITVHTSTRLTGLTGKVRAFKAKVEGPGGPIDIDVGALVLAIGAAPFDPSKLPEYKSTRSDSVTTSIEFEALLGKDGTPRHPGNDGPLKDVAFVQCVGSRMETRGNPWCSNICCAVTLKQVLALKERSPDTNVLVYYMDIRAFGRGQEELYELTKLKGVRYSRGIPSEVITRKNGSLVVRAEDASLGKVIERELDLLVLAVGLEPPEGTPELLDLLGIPPSKDGFVPIASPERWPACTGIEGIVVAGTAEFPKGIKGTVLSAQAAAMAADRALSKK